MAQDTPYLHKTYHRSKTVAILFLCFVAFAGLGARLAYLMIFQSEYYTQRAKRTARERTQHQGRQRKDHRCQWQDSGR